VQRRRVLIAMALAIVMGFAASYVVYQAVKTAQSKQPDVEQIAVAAANISVGEALTAKHIKMADWPKSTVPAGAVRTAKDAEGRMARASIVTGEPLLEAKLAPAGQGGLMPVLVPTGKRGVTIKVDEAIQKSGFVVPNSRVDVLVTLARQSGQSRESRIVLQDVMVLASDQTVEMKDNKPVTMTTVTLAVSPQEAERLALSQNEGKVTLALRNLQDNAQISTLGVTTAQLLGSPAPAPASAKPQVKTPASANRSATKRSAPPVAVATQPAVVPQAPATTPAQAAPPVSKHTVSVIKGANATDVIFVQDSERGWLEAPSKGDGAKRP
jgi:pilus assembly protein CpaB